MEGKMTDNSLAIRDTLRKPDTLARFQEVLGTQASAYISSVLVAVANSDKLQECTPSSILVSAMRAATLRLSCDPSLGHAYLVPYGKSATLQIGYKGLIQLAMRTGKYRYINVAKVYEGEQVDEDRVTGWHSIKGGKTSMKITGYVLYFALFTGYEKSYYMTTDEIHAHAQRFSKAYNSNFWKNFTEDMEKKTVLRLGLTRWGYFDPHDATAMGEVEEDRSQAVDAEMYEEPKEKHTEADNLAALGFDDTPAAQNNHGDATAENTPVSPQEAPGRAQSAENVKNVPQGENGAKSPKNVSWDESVLDALAQNWNLAKPRLMATLKYCTLPHSSSIEVMSVWMQAYKAARDAKQEPAIAAQTANESVAA